MVNVNTPLFSLIKYHLEGTCQYDGTLLERVGGLSSAEKCQSLCKGSPECKIWIYDIPQKLCVLRKSNATRCDTYVAPPSPKREECFPGIKISYFLESVMTLIIKFLVDIFRLVL